LNTPLQIGITGGIGSGKSLICRIFKCLGVPVYDADSHAKELMTTDGILVSDIKKEFGVLSYNVDGGLNREYLGQTVFNDPERLKALNRLVHPRVGVNFRQWVDQKKNHPYVLKEAALLYEADSNKSLDSVIVVYANEALRIQRVLKRDPHRTADQVMAIIKTQMPEEEKLKRADFTIRNDESTLVIPQVVSLHRRFISMHSL
jgi:dephospho-CoA kinase